jgi:hypothetical protein
MPGIVQQGGATPLIARPVCSFDNSSRSARFCSAADFTGGLAAAPDPVLPADQRGRTNFLLCSAGEGNIFPARMRMVLLHFQEVGGLPYYENSSSFSRLPRCPGSSSS